MLISGFTFFNEVDLLRLRLRHEHPFVDRIIICEATTTHAGRPKILYFDKYRDLFKPYLDKITYVVVDDMPRVENVPYLGWNNQPAPEYRWHLEEHQRSCIARGFDNINAGADDVLLVTDLDEFLDGRIARRIATECRPGEIHYPFLADFRYTVASPPWSLAWTGPFATQVRHVRNVPLSPLRLCRGIIMNRFHWRNPINNFKIFARQLRRCHTRRLQKDPELTSEDVRTARGDLPLDEHLNACRLNRGVEHRAISGWHLSFMNGGYERSTRLKRQNFAHSEAQTDGPLEDAAEDCYPQWKAFINEQMARGAYDFGSVNSSAPPFVHRYIGEFPILLTPRDTSAPQSEIRA